MNILKPYLTVLIVVAALQSCKKDNGQQAEPPAPVSEKAIVYTDSITFSLNNKIYAFDQRFTTGVGNQPVNIKKSASVIEGGKLAYETGGYHWYGVPDSTLYSVSYGFMLKETSKRLSIYFNKKYNDKELQKEGLLLKPKSNLEIFKVGNIPFAVDLDKENTMDGVAIDFDNLTTKIPGATILVRSSLSTSIQNNSSFQITKVEKLKDSIYLIEAKFEANLYDENAQLYRLKNGFMRIRTIVTPGSPGELFL
ncbi:hypothetical protein [Mucilaginibacter lacusdianchii]|uniref:hypothetical protein n=1 Tax=Mucilaginibacter lacusdianchii TaxID=2684211 RepID=UPI00131EB6F4|nr:hypothetical protein [Mucilaginibacter sp. JXJ CY 39]